MNLKHLAVIGGIIAGLAVPTGVAVAATSGPTGTPTPTPATSQHAQPAQPTPGQGYGYGAGPGYGPGYGTGDPQDCPYYATRPATDSPQFQQWRAEHRQQMGRMMGWPSPTS